MTSVVRSVYRANWDSDGQVLQMYHSDTNNFVMFGKAKIKIKDLYEFIRHMHECQVNIVEHNTVPNINTY